MVCFNFSNSKNKAAESHTEKYSLPIDVIRFLINELLDCDNDSWCHFDDDSNSIWAEVANNKAGLLINLPFPFKDKPDIIFEQKGIEVPVSWEIVSFKKKGFFGAGYITYRVPKDDLESIVSFIDVFFKKNSDMGENYKISGSIQN